MENRDCLGKVRAFLRSSYLMTRKLLLFPFLAFRRTVCPRREEIKKILVLRYDRIGDMVLSSPVFRILKTKYPGARITVVASRVNADVIKNDPYVDEIFIYKGAAHFFKEIRKERYDLAIDLFYTYELESAILAFFSGARYRLGFAIAGREIFFNVESPRISGGRNLSDYTIGLIGPQSAHGPEDRPRLYLAEEAAGWADGYLKSNNAGPGCIKVAMHPGGFYQSQRWPAERFAAIARCAAKEFGARVLLFGSEDEEGLLKEIAGMAAEAGPLLLYDIRLERTIALISRCDILIANNSGILHVGSALDIPTVSMMGPTDPALWTPAGEGDVVIRKDLKCSPCGKGSCADHSCMKLISTEDVMDAVRAQLKKRGVSQ
jgi:heptosyltransferase-2